MRRRPVSVKRAGAASASQRKYWPREGGYFAHFTFPAFLSP